jgi:hypothetical protein
MNRAQQRAIIQEANINLVNIRSLEVDYFRTFFNQFGTQCALMIGFIAGAISQVPALDNPSGAPYWTIVMYWIGSAGCVAAATHVLVCTVFISVFGQGLAIRGPVGSMISAIDGMIIEQQQVLFFFIVTVAFFAFQAIGMYWVMMDRLSAIVSTVITVIAMCLWYTHALRIFNRFRMNQKQADWVHEGDEIKDLYPSADTLNPNDYSSTGPYKKRKGLRLFQGFKFGFSRGRARSTELTSPVENPYYDMDSEGAVPNTAAADMGTGGKGVGWAKDVVGGLGKGVGAGGGEGYLSIRGPNTLFNKDAWERRYFVLLDCLIYYYKDQKSYQNDPYKPINHRPIDLEGYTMIAGTLDPPYAISLVPIDPEDIRKCWKFRCDTLSEFHRWVGILGAALQQCHTSGSNGDLLHIEGSVADSVEFQQALAMHEGRSRDGD